MKLLKEIILLLFFLPKCQPQVAAGDECPEVCKCVYKEYLIINCSAKKINTFPVIPIEVGELDYSGNDVGIITPQPLRHLRNLIKLNFSHCDIHTIQEDSFQSLEKLQEMDLSDNNLNYLFPDTFVNLADLIFLSLKGNSFLDLIPEQAIAPLPTLQILDLSYNTISELPRDYVNGWGRLKKLQRLNLKNNRISAILQSTLYPLRDTLLEELDLSGCPITQLEINAFRYLPHLQALKFEFSSIHFVSNLSQALAYTKVHTLAILSTIYNNSNNNIGTFLEHFQSGIIHTLDLSKTSFGNVTSLSFNNIPLLQQLTLNNMENSSAVLDLQIFHALYNLKSLEMQNNRFENILISPEISFKSLVKLNLINNSLNSFNWCRNINNNQTMRNVLSKLESLYLCNNVIQNLEDNAFKCFPALKHLYLRSNKNSKGNYLFSNYSFCHPKLDTLNLGFNNLDILTIQFSKIPQLRVLVLEYNNLGFLISNNGHLSLFHNLQNLEKLILSNNKITKVLEHQFRNLKSLKILDLSYNHLENLDIKILKNLPKLNALYLANNSFICDCDLHLLNYWLNTSETVLEDKYNTDGFTCLNSLENTIFNFPYHTYPCVLSLSDTINLSTVLNWIKIAIFAGICIYLIK